MELVAAPSWDLEEALIALLEKENADHNAQRFNSTPTIIVYTSHGTRMLQTAMTTLRTPG